MKAKIRKAVIPVAGLGTRFLPVTKAVPKELLPIIDRPILLFIVEEAVRAGIDTIVFIQGRGKEAIQNFFEATSRELKEATVSTIQREILIDLDSLISQVKIIHVRQDQALGLGHAIGVARTVIRDEPFAVLLGDEMMLPTEDSPSAIGQLCDLFFETGLSAVAIMKVEDSEVSKYGIVAAEPEGPNRWRVTDVVEKPPLEKAPSRLALPGRYVFDAKIFEYLATAKPGRNGEIQLTDAMSSLAKNQGMLATQVRARRFDAGDKMGYLKANVELALEHKELGDSFKEYLQTLVGGWRR